MQDKQKEAAFDVRIIQRNVAAGRLSQADIEAHIDDLEDCGEEAEWTTTQMSMPTTGDEPEQEES